MIKPFNELRPEEFDWLIVEKTTYGELEKDFPQPDWCHYPQAIRGAMGCWSLLAHYVTGEDYCKQCDCYRNNCG